MTETITLITKGSGPEPEKVKVDIRLSRMSELIKGIVEDSGSNEEIPVEQISKTTLETLLVYAEHHNYKNPSTLPCPLPSTDMTEYIDPWHISYITDLPQASFNELLSAANYLQMKTLLDLLLGYLASQIKDKDIETLKSIYDIQDDLTPDLEDEMIKEYSWVFNIDRN